MQLGGLCGFQGCRVALESNVLVPHGPKSLDYTPRMLSNPAQYGIPTVFRLHRT